MAALWVNSPALNFSATEFTLPVTFRVIASIERVASKVRELSWALVDSSTSFLYVR